MGDKIRIEDGRPDATEHSNFTGEYDKRLVLSAIRAALKHKVDPYTFLAMGLQESGFGERGDSVNPFHNWTDMTDFKLKANDKVLRNLWGKIQKTEDDKDRQRYKVYDAENEFTPVEIAYWKKYDKGGLTPDEEEIYKKMQHKVAKEKNKLKALDKIRSGLYEKVENRQNALKPKLWESTVDNAAAFLNEKFKMADSIYGDKADEELRIQAYNGLGWLPEGQYYGENRRLHGEKDRPYGKRIISLREHAIKTNPEINRLVRIAEKNFK